MADYAIGDLQGCFKEFSRLLKRVDFNPSKDHLYLVGDIVARGPDSLACLDYIYRHQDSMTVTLGNHDLHMVACHYLNKPINPKDKLGAIFDFGIHTGPSINIRFVCGVFARLIELLFLFA